MAVFKCKMCGSALEIEKDKKIIQCDYCGNVQTLPRLDDEKIERLYDRANHFRRNNDYDKAMDIYEQILEENNEDAESYWSLVLCKYGIEYVEDPSTHERMLTVNRTQFTSIFDDDNYKSAIKYADISQKVIYEKEAKKINDIQKGILEISQKEDPFDVFICYKETDERGMRTHDSVLATDLYHQLTNAGFKVFFSRITLEDKLGTAYEPYIFAALNSAKVMVVLGSKPEYFNAVWVKNEWSRFLASIKNDNKKVLIPAYKDMDPYDLPTEFSHLQSQDMNKLGFMFDLVHVIKRIVGEESSKNKADDRNFNNVPYNNVSSLLKRASLFLEEGNFDDADVYCEKVLDIDPENYNAYLYKLLAYFKIKEVEELLNVSEILTQNKIFNNAVRFADDKNKEILLNYEVKQKQIIEEKMFKALENGNFSKVDVYCEKILDIEPENYNAYLCKLLAHFNIKSKEKLEFVVPLLEEDDYFNDAVNYADDNEKELLWDLAYKQEARIEFLRSAFKNEENINDYYKMYCNNEKNYKNEKSKIIKECNDYKKIQKGWFFALINIINIFLFICVIVFYVMQYNGMNSMALTVIFSILYLYLIIIGVPLYFVFAALLLNKIRWKWGLTFLNIPTYGVFGLVVEVAYFAYLLDACKNIDRKKKELNYLDECIKDNDVNIALTEKDKKNNYKKIKEVCEEEYENINDALIENTKKRIYECYDMSKISVEDIIGHLVCYFLCIEDFPPVVNTSAYYYRDVEETEDEQEYVRVCYEINDVANCSSFASHLESLGFWVSKKDDIYHADGENRSPYYLIFYENRDENNKGVFFVKYYLNEAYLNSLEDEESEENEDSVSEDNY